MEEARVRKQSYVPALIILVFALLPSAAMASNIGLASLTSTGALGILELTWSTKANRTARATP